MGEDKEAAATSEARQGCMSVLQVYLNAVRDRISFYFFSPREEIQGLACARQALNSTELHPCPFLLLRESC